MGNKQLREVKAITQKLKDDPNFPLTEKEISMMERAKIYEQHKNQHYQDNPDVYKDEL